MFSSEERERYQAQFDLPDFGVEGQIKLKQSKIVVIGAGGLGCPTLQYLAAAGVGMLGLMDGGIITIQNLQRQVLYGIDDLGNNKAEVATKKLKLINNNILYNSYPYHLTPELADQIIRIYDIVIDCTGNYETTCLIDETCAKHNKVLMQANTCNYKGFIGLYHINGFPGFKEIYPSTPCGLNDNYHGSFGFISGILGSMMAGQAIKILTGLGRQDYGNCFEIDILEGQFKMFIKEKRQ